MSGDDTACDTSVTQRYETGAAVRPFSRRQPAPSARAVVAPLPVISWRRTPIRAGSPGAERTHRLEVAPGAGSRSHQPAAGLRSELPAPPQGPTRRPVHADLRHHTPRLDCHRLARSPAVSPPRIPNGNLAGTRLLPALAETPGTARPPGTRRRSPGRAHLDVVAAPGEPPGGGRPAAGGQRPPGAGGGQRGRRRPITRNLVRYLETSCAGVRAPPTRSSSSSPRQQVDGRRPQIGDTGEQIHRETIYVRRRCPAPDRPLQWPAERRNGAGRHQKVRAKSLGPPERLTV